MHLYQCLLIYLCCITSPIYTHSTRIVGGTQIDSIEKIPFQVSFQLFGHHFCGGSVIAPNAILTAGHCFTNIENNPFIFVRAGSADRKHGGQVVRVRKLIFHNEYNIPIGLDNDIAIAILVHDLNLSTPSVSAIPLLQTNESELESSGTIGIASGWGMLQSAGHFPTKLNAVNLTTIETKICNDLYAYDIRPVTSKMICAGHLAGGYGACNGDSGGPYFANGKLVGIASWCRQPCAYPNSPTIFTRVSQYVEWINGVVDWFARESF